MIDKLFNPLTPNDPSKFAFYIFIQQI